MSNRNIQLEKKEGKRKRTTISLSYQNYIRVKRMGILGDTFDDVIGRILEKNQMLESDSRVGTRDQTLTCNSLSNKGVVCNE